MGAALLDEFGTGDVRDRDEAWRYSKAALRGLSQLDFAYANAGASVEASLFARFDWPGTRGRRLVFVNGEFSATYSDAGRIGADVGLAHGAEGRLALTMAAGSAETVHLVYVSVAGAAPGRWRCANQILLRSGRATLVEQYVGDGGAQVLGAVDSTVTLGPNAVLTVTTLCDLPDSVSLYRRTKADVGQRASYATTQAIGGGRFQRLDLSVDLSGPQARLESRGAFVLRGRQHADTHLDVRHTARDTVSDVLWRGVADQRARGIFYGAITVAAGADGADARLSNKNLLLSAQAEIDTQPVLEIYADEVKAAHGATVGQLDQTALFYLRSRGVPAAQARSLLTAGFVREAFSDVVDADLRLQLDALLAERLPQAAAHGSNGEVAA